VIDCFIPFLHGNRCILRWFCVFCRARDRKNYSHKSRLFLLLELMRAAYLLDKTP
jgi:hypothetical protein